ncbi:MAG TPA: carboxypeptidase-like regulatory domain-containing protein [Thermoplasmata archaeon]|nr:carboxypeptidase-like regulatory domain-containing protein [Thermoplasmata archaeon]
MASPGVTIRCPACGTDLRVVLAPAPPTQWFPCPHCRTPIPVVVPREPPPLYTWEVLPGLYPELPAPRAPRVSTRRAVAVALVAVALVAIVTAGFLAVSGAEASAPGSFTVSGTVWAQTSAGIQPATGALVQLSGENHYAATTTVGFDGGFSLSGVPTGGVLLNISLRGYSPVSVYSFVSSVYSAGATDIGITLSPGSASNLSAVAYTPFNDLETFLASIGAGVVLLALAAIVAGGAAWVTLRRDRPAVGVVGGSAGVFAPLALYFLALGIPFPLLLAVSGVAAAAGAFALGARAIEMAQTGDAPRPD